MQILNMELLKSPQNWLKIGVMLFLAFVLLFFLMHVIAPKSVEPPQS